MRLSIRLKATRTSPGVPEVPLTEHLQLFPSKIGITNNHTNGQVYRLLLPVNIPPSTHTIATDVQT